MLLVQRTFHLYNAKILLARVAFECSRDPKNLVQILNISRVLKNVWGRFSMCDKWIWSWQLTRAFLLVRDEFRVLDLSLRETKFRITYFLEWQ